MSIMFTTNYKGGAIMDTFKIKTGDTKPYLAVTLQDSDGNAIDLTGATVDFNLGDSGYANVYTGSAVITDETAGQCEYRWDGTLDIGTAGKYFGEFEVTLSDSKVITFPDDHGLIIDVSQDYS